MGSAYAKTKIHGRVSNDPSFERQLNVDQEFITFMDHISSTYAKNNITKVHKVNFRTSSKVYKQYVKMKLKIEKNQILASYFSAPNNKHFIFHTNIP